MATLKDIYDALKADGAPMPDTYDAFKGYMTAPGKQGVKNRQEFYNALKADGAPLQDTYEEFSKALFTPAGGQHGTGKQQGQYGGTISKKGGQKRWSPGSMLTGVDVPLKTEPQKRVEEATGGGAEMVPTLKAPAKPFKPTEGQKNAMAADIKRKADNAERQLEAQVQAGKEHFDELQKYYGSTEAMAKQSKVIRQELDPETGEVKDVWMTPYGNTTDNADIAEMQAHNFAQDTRPLTEEEKRTSNRRDVASLRQEVNQAHLERAQAISDRYSGVYDAMSRAMATGAALQNDSELQAYEEALHSLDRAQKMIDEVDAASRKGDWWGAGVVRGAADKLFDVNTWDFGIAELSKSVTMKRALDAFDAGRELTKAQRAMLDAAAVELATTAYFGSSLGRAYKAGEVTAQAIPFMIEMVLNPLSSVGKRAVNKLARYAIQRYGKEAVKKGGQYATRYMMSKIGTRLAADVAGAAGMTVTTGSVGTMADIIDRLNGTVEMGVNDKGRTVAVGHTKGDDLMTAIRKGVTARTIENWSEMAGMYFAPLLKPLGKAAGNVASKGLNRIGASQITEMIRTMPSTQWGKIMNDFTTQTQWHGVGSEFAEEMVGGIANALLVGDQTLDRNPDTGVFNTNNMIDTFLGVSVLGAVISGVKTVGYRTPKYEARKARDKAEKEARMLFGEERWHTLAPDLQGDDAQDAIMGLRGAGYNEAQIKAAIKYAGKCKAYEGMLLAEEKRRTDETRPKEEDELEVSYESGRTMEPGAETAAEKSHCEQLRDAVVEKYGEAVAQAIDDGDPQVLADIAQEGSDIEGIAMAYANARATVTGIEDRASDELEDRITEMEARVNAVTHKDSGQLQEVKLRNNEGQWFVVTGNVEGDDAGKVVRDKSDSFVVVRNFATGELVPVSLDKIETVSASVDAAKTIEIVARKLAEAHRQETAEAETRQYNMNDEVTLRTPDGREVKGVIRAPEDADGLIQVETSEPLKNGLRVGLYTREELDQMGTQVNPAEDETETSPTPGDGAAARRYGRGEVMLKDGGKGWIMGYDEQTGEYEYYLAGDLQQYRDRGSRGELPTHKATAEQLDEIVSEFKPEEEAPTQEPGDMVQHDASGENMVQHDEQEGETTEVAPDTDGETAAAEPTAPQAEQQPAGNNAVVEHSGVPVDENGNMLLGQAVDAQTGYDALLSRHAKEGRSAEKQAELAAKTIALEVEQAEAALKAVDKMKPAKGESAADFVERQEEAREQAESSLNMLRKIAELSAKTAEAKTVTEAAPEATTNIEKSTTDVEKSTTDVEIGAENAPKSTESAETSGEIEPESADSVENGQEQAGEATKGDESRRDSLYSVSGIDSGRGGRFYSDKEGNIDLVELPEDIWNAIRRKKLPFRMTESMASHIFERHAQELGLDSVEEAVEFAVEVMNQADHVRDGGNGKLIFSVENSRNRIGKRAIAIVVDAESGNFLGIKTAGYDRIKNIEKSPLLWMRREIDSASEDAVSSTVASMPASENGSPTGITSAHSSGSYSGGKDNTSASKKQGKGVRSSARSSAPGSLEGVDEKYFTEEPLDELELVASMFGGKSGLKILPEDFRRETSLGVTEQRKLVGIIASKANGGITIEAAAERAVELDNDEHNGRFFGGDTSMARNTVIELLLSGNPRRYIKEHREALARKAAEAERNQYDTYCWDAYGMSADEWDAYEEQRQAEMAEAFKNFDDNEYYGILADDYARNKEYYDRREEEHEQPDSAGEGQEDGRGGNILPTEGVDEASGVADGAQRESSGAATDGREGSDTSGGLGAPSQPVSAAERVAAASADVETSPTEAQKEAGNYKKAPEAKQTPEMQRKAEASRPSSLARRLGEAMVGLLRKAGIEVVTDATEMRRVLDAGDAQLKARLTSLSKAAATIREWANNNARDKRIEIDLPKTVRSLIKKRLGRDFDTHNITSNGIAHAYKNHGEGGKKLGANSIPLRKEDLELIPYIMTAPDRVIVGNPEGGRVSVRFVKRLSNGEVVVVEKEYKNSPDDMETITMWAELSSNALDAAKGAPKHNVRNAIISTDDAAKIRKDAENAIAREAYNEQMTAWHGSPQEFDSFDSSHMGEGEGMQAHGWGHYVAFSQDISKGYAARLVRKGPWLKELMRIYGAIEAYERNIKGFPKELKDEKDYIKGLEEQKRDFEKEAQRLKEQYGEDSVEYRNHMFDKDDYIDIKITHAKAHLKEVEAQQKRDRQALERLKEEHAKKLKEEPKGTLYEVEIPDDNGENYLHEGKTIPKIHRRRIADVVRRMDDSKLQWSKHGSNWLTNGLLTLANAIVNNQYDAAEVRGRLVDAFGSEKKASEIMLEAGFVGIKYNGKQDGPCAVIFKDEDIKIMNRAQFLRTSKGEVYGFVKDGKVYIDPALMNPDTPVHEYTHLWDKAVKAANPKLWARGVELMKELPLWDEVKNDPAYKDIADDEDLIASEVHSRLSGPDGKRLLDTMVAENTGKGVLAAAKAISLREQVLAWLRDMVKAVRSAFNGKWGNKELDSLTLDEWTRMPLKDLVEGVNPNEIASHKGMEKQILGEKGAASESGRNADKSRRTIDDGENGGLEESPQIGAFGEIYTQFRGKPIEAVTYLLAKRDGEAIGALYHKEIGDIDLVWGEEGTGHSDGYGLAKLAKYHPEVLFNLQEILNDMVITKRSENRVQLESDKYQAAVRLTWDNEAKTWLLTMFEKKNSALDNTTDTVETLSSNGNDTATPENTVISSERKDKGFAPEKQGNEQKSSVQQSVKAASAEVNTNPTEAQIEAGNYKKGHVTVGDFDITIENPAGSVRSGTDANGTKWETTMANTYGYIKGTEGVDGDHIDVFLAGDMDAWDGRKVFVVDQTKADGSFDEHKVMLGFNDKDEAFAAYLANYDKDWAQTHQGLRISEANIDDFKKWVESSHRKTKAFSEYASVAKITDNAPTGHIISGEGYTIAPKPYTNKQGKTLGIPVRIVKDAEEVKKLPEYGVLLRQDEGALSDDELSYENDIVARLIGKHRYSKKERRLFAERERARMVKRVSEMARKLHLDNVDVVTDTSGLSGNRARAKGYYNKRTGRITVVIPNNTSAHDAEITLLHEAVAHYGLRQLFGEHFDDFLDNVYYNADADIRRRIVELMSKNGWDSRKATEEYLASLAEDTEFERMDLSWWSKIKRLFMDMLHKIGLKGFDGVTLTDNELRYLLYRSYQNLAYPGRYKSIIGEALDIAQQQDLKVGNFREATAEASSAAEGGVEDEQVALDRVNERFNSQLEELTEKNADSTIFDLGNPSAILQSAGVANKPIKLYGSKLVAKAKKHGFGLQELHNLPRALSSPIAVFNNFKRDGNRSVLVEIKTSDGNFLVSIDLGEGHDADFDIVRTVFGKSDNKIVNWINKGFLCYVDKNKALDYLNLSAPIAAASERQELDSAAKIIENFENPTIETDENDILFRDGDPEERDRVSARERYERRLKTGAYQSYEALADSMAGLKEAMYSILDTEGQDINVEDVAGFENAYIGENRLQSTSQAELDAMARLPYPDMRALGAAEGLPVVALGEGHLLAGVAEHNGRHAFDVGVKELAKEVLVAVFPYFT